MSQDDQRPARNRVTPSVGGTGTPISGSEDGSGELDPVMSEIAGRTTDEETSEEETA